MKNCLKAIVLSGITVLAVLLALPGCTNEANTKQSSPTASSPTPTAPIFRSEKFHLSVQMPLGWTGAEGSQALSIKTLYGDVAFNSWGQKDFWTRAATLNHSAADDPTPIISYTYGTGTVMSQVPDGGAYVALVEIDGPPYGPGTEPSEYTLNDLSGLITPHDWRQDVPPSAQFFEFYKWENSLRIEIACKVDASDATLTNLNNLLQSWRFDEIVAGDSGWAFPIARQLLPEQVEPLKFSNVFSTYHDYDQNVTRATKVDVLPDKTVHFRFTYFWDIPSDLNSVPPESPSSSNHWWEIDVLPTGKAVLTSQGGVTLPPPGSPPS